jgi:hypothetical protein
MNGGNHRERQDHIPDAVRPNDENILEVAGVHVRISGLEVSRKENSGYIQKQGRLIPQRRSENAADRPFLFWQLQSILANIVQRAIGES